MHRNTTTIARRKITRRTITPSPNRGITRSYKSEGARADVGFTRRQPESAARER